MADKPIPQALVKIHKLGEMGLVATSFDEVRGTVDRPTGYARIFSLVSLYMAHGWTLVAILPNDVFYLTMPLEHAWHIGERDVED